MEDTRTVSDPPRRNSILMPESYWRRLAALTGPRKQAEFIREAVRVALEREEEAVARRATRPEIRGPEWARKIL